MWLPKDESRSISSKTSEFCMPLSNSRTVKQWWQVELREITLTYVWLFNAKYKPYMRNTSGQCGIQCQDTDMWTEQDGDRVSDLRLVHNMLDMGDVIVQLITESNRLLNLSNHSQSKWSCCIVHIMHLAYYRFCHIALQTNSIRTKCFCSILHNHIFYILQLISPSILLWH